jgi:hypothetical protein
LLATPDCNERKKALIIGKKFKTKIKMAAGVTKSHPALPYFVSNDNFFPYYSVLKNGTARKRYKAVNCSPMDLVTFQRNL